MRGKEKRQGQNERQIDLRIIASIPPTMSCIGSRQPCHQLFRAVYVLLIGEASARKGNFLSTPGMLFMSVFLPLI